MKYIKEFEVSGYFVNKTKDFIVSDFVKHTTNFQDTNIYRVKRVGKGTKLKKYYIELYQNGDGQGFWRSGNSLELADQSPALKYESGDYVFVNNYDWVNKYYRSPYCKIKFLNSKKVIRAWDYMVTTFETKQVSSGNPVSSKEREIDAYLNQYDIKRKMTQDEIDTFDARCIATKYNL